MKTVSVYLAIVLLSINSAKSEPPILSQSDEVTLEKNQTFRIQCTSNVPVRWMNSIESQYMDSNDVHTFHSMYFTLPDGSYGSEMVLESVKHGSVGYYYCIKNITYEEDDEFLDKPELLEKLIDDEEASRIYVFVRDFDNLIAPIGLPIIYVNRNEDTIVPCKPTSKETTVELVGTQSEIMSSDETSRMYDPKKGFVINIDRVEKAGDYKCRPKYPSVTNKDECLDFMVELTNLSPPTDQIHPPTISSESDGHAVIGNTFTFECSIEYDANIYIKMEWILPKHVSLSDNRIEVMDPRAERSDMVGKKKAISELIIRNVRKNDEGIYKCRVQDNGNSENHDKQLLRVLEEGENYIEMKPLAGVQTTEYALIPGEVFQMAVDWKSFPKVPRDHITWLKDGKEIRNNSNYDILILDKTILLKIRKASYKEAGIYTLALNNTLQRKEMNFTFLVEGKPEVHLADQYVIEGEEAVVDCTVLSTAEPYIAWEYKKCKLNPWPTCLPYQKNINITSSEKLATKDRLKTIIRMKFTPDEPGFIKCSAQNNIGVSHKVAELLISDIPKPFSLEGYDNTERIAIGDELILKCSTLLYNQSSDISWLKDDFPVRESDSILIENVNTKYSHQSILRILSITSKDNGIYKCQAGDREDPKMLYIEAVPAEPLTWDPQSTPDGKTLDMKLADSLELNCRASGLPVPKATWFKDGNEILKDDENYSFSNNEYNQILTLRKFVRPEDDGRYKCVLSNRLDKIEKTFKVNVVGIKLKTGWIFVILGLILGLILAIIYLAIKIKRKNRELKKAGLYKFAEGNIEHYNPALDLDEQAELLPYDNNYEFPRESLKLGKQLGAGAFGVVVEAIAKKIKPTEEETKVAVKMVKRTADNEVIMALVSELKIMIHMGQHLNVVNLLGAVTKKIAKREIMIIVEYCEYGNVQNLLMKNRKYFINQINPETDKIDSSIMEKRSSASEYESNINGLRYIRPVFTKHYSNDISATRSDNEPRSGTRAGRPNSRGYIRQSDLYDSNTDSCNTEQTIMTTIPEGDGSAVMSNNSVQPAWRSNYKPQNTDPIALTTTDLVSWAYQVAKGMEYLSSKKVLHGDLAARNILLCENNVVKICDFGLARSMYKGDNYKKQGEARLPIKWLALESLESQVFSTYTDVWSFGIVLWEFFSLAKVPYPGMDVHPNFLNKLKDGYRMEKPTYANQELYDIMLACWHVRPESRPLFNELGNRFGAFLEEDVTNHYMQLNEPYMSFNDEYLSKRELDLNILRPPEKMAPKAPIYVNGNINRYDIPQIRIDRGSNDNYLQMNANITAEDEGIFSPTRHSDEVFNYPSLKKSVKPEEIPMLSRRTQRFSDSEGEHSPDADSRSRGFHELNHSISSTDDNQDNDYLESKSYLGMNGGTRDAFSNPSYQMLKTVNEK